MKKKSEIENKSKVDQTAQRSVGIDNSFAIVGIGFGAKSLASLQIFFSNLPANPNVCFVLLSSSIDRQPKNLEQALESESKLPIVHAVDGQALMPNTIYLTPDDKEIGLHQKRLLFFEPKQANESRMRIDHFFESLANDQGTLSVGIIFSGIGTDGETGIRMIKEKFGMTMSQQLEPLAYHCSPATGAQHQFIDYVLPPENMPGRLIEYLRHPALTSSTKNNLDSPENEVHIQKILMLLRASSGHDFSQYKKNTILRRIERRLAYHQLSGCESYIAYLRENPSELDILFNELLINVTKFFRDKTAFDTLKANLYKLLKSKEATDPIRIWIAGCSTGEEAYSVAILIAEYLEQSASHLQVKPQIFATDLDAQAIEQARAGFYFSNIVSELSEQQLNRYFDKKNNGYSVKKEIRETVIFAQHNLAKDAPFTRLDLLCCRNVMIYLNAELQKKIIPIFHYSLNNKGLLFLGPAESINGYQDVFEVVDAKWKIFRRKVALSAVGKSLDFPFHVAGQDKLRKSEANHKSSLKNTLAEHFNRLLLKNHTPAAFLLSEKGEILFVNGNPNRYIELHAGEAVMNIHRMIREELRYVLSNAFHQAQRHRSSVSVKDVKIVDTNSTLSVSFTVRYLDESSLQGMFLVTFYEHELPKSHQHRKKGNSGSTVEMEELEKELNYTKQQLHSTIEQMETSVEELTSTNEELQSTNEELQSTNEEALTTKEEMQSLNEELMTMNHQYQTKTEELIQVNNDMKNLLDNIEIGTIFLDTKLRILRFTPQITKLFNVIPTDVGRSITHIASHVDYPAIEDTIQAVIDTLVGKELEVRTKSDEWYNLRIMPYRTTDNFISGAVLTFTKTTSTKSLRTQFSGLLTYAFSTIHQHVDPVIVLDADFKSILYNDAFLKFSNLTKSVLEELSFLEIVSNKWQMKELVDALKVQGPSHTINVRHPSKGDEVLHLQISIEKLVDELLVVQASVITFHPLKGKRHANRAT